MHDVRKVMRQLADAAYALHQQEREMTLNSLELVGKLENYNAAVNLGLTSAMFARFIGLTPNQYWKRAQAARVVSEFPRAMEMIRDGETMFSILALVAPKITHENAEVLLEGIKNRTKREAEHFLSFVPPVSEDGVPLPMTRHVRRLKLVRTAPSPENADGTAGTFPENVGVTVAPSPGKEGSKQNAAPTPASPGKRPSGDTSRDSPGDTADRAKSPASPEKRPSGDTPGKRTGGVPADRTPEKRPPCNTPPSDP